MLILAFLLAVLALLFLLMNSWNRLGIFPCLLCLVLAVLVLSFPFWRTLPIR